MEDSSYIYEWIFRIVAIVAPILTGLGAIWVNRRQSVDQIGAEFARAAFEKLYKPFFLLYGGIMLSNHCLSTYPMEVQGELLDIITHNLVYMSPKAFRIASRLTELWLNFMENPDDEAYTSAMNIEFETLKKCLISDRERLIRPMKVFR